MKRSIEKLRLEYGNFPLEEKGMKSHPIEQFIVWFDQARKAEVMEPNGMSLATLSSAGHPSCRTVLLKRVDENGFCFFTDSTSRKGEHLALSPFGAVTFWWKEIFRQVNAEGKVFELSRREAESYFYKRPKGAQLAAVASHQSRPLASREELEEAYEVLKKKYRGRIVPCPKSWAGYRLEPERVEFWQGRKNRLHDRFLYVKTDGNWIFSRLAP